MSGGLVKVKVLKDIQNCEKMCVVKGFICWIVDKVKVKFKFTNLRIKELGPSVSLTIGYDSCCNLQSIFSCKFIIWIKILLVYFSHQFVILVVVPLN